MVISITQLKLGIMYLGIGSQHVTPAPQYEDFMRFSVGIPCPAGDVAQITVKLMTVSPTGPIVGPGSVTVTPYVNDKVSAPPLVLYANNSTIVKGIISKFPISSDVDLLSLKTESTLPDNVSSLAAFVTFNSWAAYMSRQPPRI